MTKPKSILSMLLLAAAAVVSFPVFASREAILLELPTLWMAFDNNMRTSSGATNPKYKSDKSYELVANADGVGKHLKGTGEGPYGDDANAFPFNNGDWTVISRVKSVNSENKVIWNLGRAGSAGTHALVLISKNSNTLKLSIYSAFALIRTVDIPVTGIDSAFHDLAFIFSLADHNVSVWLDGVDTNVKLAYSEFSPNDYQWQFFSIMGGLGSSGLSFGVDCCIDDFRFYQRALNATELAALHEGRTQVPVFGGYVAADDLTIWKNIQLKDIVRFRALTGGTAIGNHVPVPFYETRTTTSAVMQMQMVDDGTYNKVTKIQYTQSGDDVVAKALYSKYVQPSGSGGINATQGNDFDVNPATGGTIAVGGEANGYGLHQLTADTLYDDNAAIWNTTDGTFSTAANWRDNDAVAAGRPLSFVTGTGTVQNDFAAGTAFGRLAMGIESGARTVTGNACSFDEVINASTSALTFTAPQTYEGDFKPYSLGPITFTALNVGGTFQPVGSGDIIFAGESHIHKADIRYHVKTGDRGVYAAGGSGWTTFTGYFNSDKQAFHVLRTLSGGTTYIDELQQSLAGQRRQTTVLDGNFVLGGNPLPGSDALLAIDNGTTTFQNFFQPTSTIGINCRVYVHGNGTLNLPGINSTTSVFLDFDGTVNAGDASAATALYLAPVTTAGTGTFNARLLGGSAITARGVTIGPEGAVLAIPTAITLQQNAGDPGVTFRTSSPEGTPGLVSMSAALAPGSVPLAITGGGTFSYLNQSALTLASLSVAANTTADFSNAGTVTLTDTTLAAGARILLKNGTTALPFTNKPTLPAEGVATVVVTPTLALEAGEITLAADGWTAEDLDHFAIAFAGNNAAVYSAALSVVDGALKATISKTAPTAGPKTQQLIAAGYVGATALQNFPALIKFPDCIPGFRFDEARNDGSDVWFEDANGNRLDHEIESWNRNGEGFAWVRIPSLTKTTSITVHWGGDAVAASAKGSVWGTHVGVWHMNEQDGNALDSTAHNYDAERRNGGSGDSIANMVGCDAVVGGGRINGTVSGLTGGNYFAAPNYNECNVGDTFTLSGWFYTASIVGYPRPFSRKDSNADANGWELQFNNSATAIGMCGASGTRPAFTVPNPNGRWNYYSFVYNGTTATLYVDGKLIGSGTITAATDNGKILSIGNNCKGNERSWYGNLDEIRLNDAVESGEWIKACYDTMKTPAQFFVTPAAAYQVITGSTYETEPPYGCTTEYAGSHVLAYTYPEFPIVISGDVTETAEYGLFNFYDATVTVKEGGTLTLTRNVRFGEYNTLTAGHTLGAHLVIEGGLVQAPNGSLDYSGYNSVDFGAENAARPQVIDMTGGKFTVTLKGWQRNPGHAAPNNAFNVGGTAEFAPDAFGWRNTVADYTHAFHWYVTMDGTGRFTIPVSGVPDVVHVDVAGGTPSLAAAGAGTFGGTLELAAGKALCIGGTTPVVPTGVITGTGGLVVTDGATLDMTSTAMNITDFTGTITVQNGGTLILPADRTPPYAISLEAGAHVVATVTDAPGGTAPFLGALASVPNEGTATIEFVLPVSVPQGSAYTLSTSELPAGAAAHLAIAFTGDAAETTQGVIEVGENGEIIARITESAAKGALEWKGSVFSSSNSDLAWWQYGSEDTTLYPFMPNVTLWFTDRGETTLVNVANAVKPDSVHINATQDYEFRGAKLDAATVVKEGSGTVTYNGGGYVAPTEVDVKAGTLRLGSGAPKDVLGGTGTRVVIEDGATLNLNSRLVASGDTNNGAALNDNIVSIAGAGANGAGAIVNDNPNDSWQYDFGRVELADNATIGGTSRIDVRKSSNAQFPGNASVAGAGKTLTVKTHVAEAINCGLNFNNTDVNLGKLVLADGGMIGFEGTTALTIADGIEMGNNSRVHYWNATGVKAPIVVTGTGAGLKCSSTAANTQDRSVTINAGASLDLRGDQTLTYSGGVTNNGAVSVTAARHNFTGGDFAGTGAWNMNGGEMFWYGALNLDAPKTLNLAGGTFFYGKETDAVAPLNQKVTVNATGGQFAFNIGQVCTITSNNVEFNGNPTHIHFFSRNDASSFVTLANISAAATTQMLFGGASDGRYYLDNGTTLSTKEFYLNGSSKIADVTLRTGSTLNISDIAKIGNNAADTSRMVIDGGTINQTGTKVFELGPNAKQIDVTLKSGTMTVYGIQCREGWKDPATFGEQFTMEGGTLNMNGDALRAWTHFNHFCEFNNGTLNSSQNWVVERMRSSAFGDRAGGHVEFKLNDKTVNWATGLSGAADVTLKGTGTLKTGYAENTSNQLLQGIVSGKWTIENTGNNDLSGAAAFLGGLELAEDVSAKVHIAGSNLVEAVYLQTSATAMTSGDSMNAAYPFACNDLKTMHAHEDSATFDKGQFMWQGLFYADTAGTWTFAGGYDDAVDFQIDGTQVVHNETWSSVVSGKIELSVGWHEFRLIQYQNGGGWGSVPSGWTGVMNLGFAKSSVDDVNASHYQRFDGQHIPLKAGPVTAPGKGMVNWSSVHNYNASTWKTRDDLTANGLYKMSDLNTYNIAATPTFSGSTHQFDGWFFVKPALAGDWSVNVNYDDQGDLWIDDVDIGADGSKQKATVVTVNGITPGWHKFVLRVADNTGNWGPWGDAGTCVTITVNGQTCKFDESAFYFSPIRPAEYAGLDGELKLNAGSTLTNDQTVDACPIWGTLKGTGTLSGKFAFAGEQNSWEVTGVYNGRNLTAVTFDNADAAALAGLKNLKVKFDQKPICGVYVVGAALGADPAKIELEVSDAADNDLSENFELRVADNQLQLNNLRLRGTVIYFR